MSFFYNKAMNLIQKCLSDNRIPNKSFLYDPEKIEVQKEIRFNLKEIKFNLSYTITFIVTDDNNISVRVENLITDISERCYNQVAMECNTINADPKFRYYKSFLDVKNGSINLAYDLLSVSEELIAKTAYEIIFYTDDVIEYIYPFLLKALVLYSRRLKKQYSAQSQTRG